MVKVERIVKLNYADVLPPGSISEPYSKGLTPSPVIEHMVQLMVASKWFSNIPSKDYELFAKYFAKRIRDTKMVYTIKNGILQSQSIIVEAMITLMKNIEKSGFDYDTMGINYDNFWERICSGFMIEKTDYENQVYELNNLAEFLVRHILEAVFIFTVYECLIKSSDSPDMDYKASIEKPGSSPYWKFRKEIPRMRDRNRFAKEDAKNLNCWWYLNETRAGAYTDGLDQPSLWGNPPMGSILYLYSKKQGCSFKLMLNTNIKGDNKASNALRKDIRRYNDTQVDCWSFMSISIPQPLMILVKDRYEHLDTDKLDDLEYLETHTPTKINSKSI